jgi:hypothetical protein
VSEIGADGAVARLTSTTFVDGRQLSAAAAAAGRQELSPDGVAAAAAEFAGIAGEENGGRLRALLERILDIQQQQEEGGGNGEDGEGGEAREKQQQQGEDADKGGGKGPLVATLLPVASKDARTVSRGAGCCWRLSVSVAVRAGGWRLESHSLA